jgi:two-component system, NtrC family, sensor kinase
LITEQKRELEQKVEERTYELKRSLKELKETQAQLVQSEKMASLGELTAGIAHEIQNPLNFINNFSEVNQELVADLVKELNAGDAGEALEIAKSIGENEQKIAKHGTRAGSIVKSMLEHSRQSSGKKEDTDLNALVDEYQRLAYHGMRAKDKAFHTTIDTQYDESIGKIRMVPQDLGRAFLNILNNAFYAVQQKSEQPADAYQPCISIFTKRLADIAQITFKDNGTGIPEKVKDKIFQPFFTTKPSGYGTGLGLSLSYDIVVKEHQGTLTVNSKEGQGTEFIIQLPISP